jgi:hypothetical protein
MSAAHVVGRPRYLTLRDFNMIPLQCVGWSRMEGTTTLAGSDSEASFQRRRDPVVAPLLSLVQCFCRMWHGFFLRRRAGHTLRVASPEQRPIFINSAQRRESA